MLRITVKFTVTYSYLYPLYASVMLLPSTTNRAAYRRCLHSNVSRHVRVERLTPNSQSFLIVPSHTESIAPCINGFIFVKGAVDSLTIAHLRSGEHFVRLRFYDQHVFNATKIIPELRDLCCESR